MSAKLNGDEKAQVQSNNVQRFLLAFPWALIAFNTVLQGVTQLHISTIALQVSYVSIRVFQFDKMSSFVVVV
jgi:hypothetical protein